VVPGPDRWCGQSGASAGDRIGGDAGVCLSRGCGAPGRSRLYVPRCRAARPPGIAFRRQAGCECDTGTDDGRNGGVSRMRGDVMNKALGKIEMKAPFDTEKLDRLMDEAGLDVLIAASRHNVQYLLGGYRFFFFDVMEAIGTSRYLPAFVYQKGRPENTGYI